MRATMTYGAKDVRVENVPDAKILGSTDALVRVTRACICGNGPQFAEAWTGPWVGSSPLPSAGKRTREGLTIQPATTLALALCAGEGAAQTGNQNGRPQPYRCRSGIACTGDYAVRTIAEQLWQRPGLSTGSMRAR